MKKIKFISLVSSLLMFAACSNESPTPAGDCLYSSFREAYANYIHREDGFYIKGKVVGDVSYYGKKIEILEDFKGNITDNSPITVWGDGGVSNRVDNLREYNLTDTLIMLLVHSNQEEDYLRNPDNPKLWNEKTTDYSTCGCSASVLKLSNGQVTGLINPIDTATVGTYISTMSWNELQDLLNNN